MAETESVSREAKPPPAPPSPLPPVPPLLSSKKMSNACERDLQRVARSKETDSDIFALGEAVSQLDIDDVLSGVGSDLSELLNADDGSVTSTSCRLSLDRPPTAHDRYAAAQVSRKHPLLRCRLAFALFHARLCTILLKSIWRQALQKLVIFFKSLVHRWCTFVPIWNGTRQGQLQWKTNRKTWSIQLHRYQWR